MTEQAALAAHERGQEAQSEGRHDEAIAQFAIAAGHFEGADGFHSPDLANVLADQADSLLELCRYADAEAVARRAAEILRTVRDGLDQESRAVLLPRVYGIHGRTLRELGRYPEAEPPLAEAIREAEAGLGADHPQVASHLNEYGILCKYWGRFETGEEVYRRALRIFEQAYGAQSPETATIYHNLGGLEH